MSIILSLHNTSVFQQRMGFNTIKMHVQIEKFTNIVPVASEKFPMAILQVIRIKSIIGSGAVLSIIPQSNSQLYQRNPHA